MGQTYPIHTPQSWWHAILGVRNTVASVVLSLRRFGWASPRRRICPCDSIWREAISFPAVRNRQRNAWRRREKKDAPPTGLKTTEAARQMVNRGLVVLHVNP